MSTYTQTSSALNLDTPKKRLDWLLSEGYKVPIIVGGTTIPPTTSMDEYLKNQSPQSLVFKDLAGSNTTVSKIYQVFYKDEIQDWRGYMPTCNIQLDQVH